jgi:hypothetical protein
MIWIDFRNLGSGPHELTVAVSTMGKLAYINEFSPLIDRPTNSSGNGKIFVTAKTDSDNFDFRIAINESANAFDHFDPLNVTTLPFSQTPHSLSQDGELGFGFSLNNSEPLDTCTFQFAPWNDHKIEDLQLSSTDLRFDSINYSDYGTPFCWLENLSTCRGRISFHALTGDISGTIGLSVSGTQKKLNTPVECNLDGLLVRTNNLTRTSYDLGKYDFFLEQEPTYYFTGGNNYCINFPVGTEFQLRIDAQHREEIDYLTVDSLPSSFAISELDLGGEPCYIFTFKLDSASNCRLGLDLKDKGWFFDPENMSLNEIPDNIKQTWLTSSGSTDGDKFDLDSEYVKEWAKQVTKNQTNPFIIADLVFQNVTRTLSYPTDWRKLEGQTYNETVSETLRARSGVCRHYARTFAALCICSGLPARSVIGTAFNFLNETHKKNHEWAEIYLPGYGWITMDPAWGQEFLLDDRHVSITRWPTSSENLNVTSPDEALRAQLKSESGNLVSRLIQLCDQLVNKSQSNLQAEILLDKAKLLVTHGQIHDALISVAAAYSLSIDNTSAAHTNPFEPWLVLLILATTVAAVVVFYYAKRRGNRHLDASKLFHSEICG